MQQTQLVLSFVQRRPGYVEPNLSVPELRERSFSSACEVWAFLAQGDRKQVALERRLTVGPTLAPRQEFLSSDEILPGLLSLH
jgi:hypothetical protein